MSQADGTHAPSPRRRAWLVALGIMLVCVAVAALASGAVDSLRAKMASDHILATLDKDMPEPFAAPMDADVSVVGDAVVSENEGMHPTDEQQLMPVKVVDDYAYVGAIVVPSLGINLPVAAETDAARLHLSPCRYSGGYYSDDLVICGEGHSSQFGSLASAGIRDEVRFVAVNGATYRYVVSNVETSTERKQIGAIVDDWDLALFKYNVDGSCCIVRCVRTA